MIGFFARMLPIAFRARRAEGETLVSTLPLRVQLREIDINVHMNQAEYPRVMELGRTDWFLRTGAWRRWRARGINPMVAEQTLTYRRELKPRQRYAIDTRAVGVEGRFLVVESHILVGERVHTRGVAQLLFVGPQGVMKAAEVAELAAEVQTSPLVVHDWTVHDRALPAG